MLGEIPCNVAPWWGWPHDPESLIKNGSVTPLLTTHQQQHRWERQHGSGIMWFRQQPKRVRSECGRWFFSLCLQLDQWIAWWISWWGKPRWRWKNTVELWLNSSIPYQVGVLLDDVAAENKVLASGVSFLTEQHFFENRYHNQKKSKQRWLHLWP